MNVVVLLADETFIFKVQVCLVLDGLLAHVQNGLGAESNDQSQCVTSSVIAGRRADLAGRAHLVLTQVYKHRGRIDLLSNLSAVGSDMPHSAGCYWTFFNTRHTTYGFSLTSCNVLSENRNDPM